MLSRLSYRTLFLSALCSLFVFQPLHAAVKIGAVGDSMTDEYLDSGTNANTDIAAYNWVEILGLLRGDDLDWGEYRAPGVNQWPDYRAAGYQYNYAKVAATASKSARMTLDVWLFDYAMEIDGSAVGSKYVTDQVTAFLHEPVEYAVVAAGSNDYFFKTHHFSVTGSMLRNEVQPDQAFNTEIAQVLLSHVDRLLAKGIKVVLATIPLGTAGGADEQVIAAIKSANALLLKGAAERSIPTVSLFDFAKNDDGGVTVGDFTVVYGSAATTADLLPQGSPHTGKCRSDKLCAWPTHRNHFIADDGLHPNTLIQGLMANQVIKVLNQAYQLNIKTLSDAELLGLTGK